MVPLNDLGNHPAICLMPEQGYSPGHSRGTMNYHMNSLAHSPGWNSLVNHLVIGGNDPVNHMVHTPCDSLGDSLDTVNYLVIHMVDWHGSSPCHSRGNSVPLDNLVSGQCNSPGNSWPLNYLVNCLVTRNPWMTWWMYCDLPCDSHGRFTWQFTRSFKG